MKAGNTTITIKGDNNQKAECKVTVTDSAALTLNPTSVVVHPKKTANIAITLAPTTAKITKVESADKNIATVELKDKTIVVTGVKVGKTKVTVVSDNGKTAECAIEVKNGAESDTTTKLKDKNGNQVYVLENGKYREAVYADYYKFNEFYLP